MSTPRATPAATPDTPNATAPDTGAGTTAPALSSAANSEVPGTAELVVKPAPGSPDFDVDTDDVDALEKHVRILSARKQLAELTAVNEAAPAAPATFTAPSATLIGKYDSVTELVQHLPQKLWDMMSEEDQARFTDTVAEKPADLPTA